VPVDAQRTAYAARLPVVTARAMHTGAFLSR
jgi:hypothetical protein